MGIACCKKPKQIYELLPFNDEPESILSSNTMSRHFVPSINPEAKFETFTIIWLDQNAKDSQLDSLRTRTLLCEINCNKNCLFYNDLQIFLDDLNINLRINHKILLIISGTYAEQIINNSPHIFNLISIIIIFCNDYDRYKKYLGRSNIIEICIDYDSLKTCIIREIPSLKFNLFQNRSFKMFQSLTTKLNSSSRENFDNLGAYFSYKLFVELLKEIPQNDQAKELMLKQCQNYYRQDNSEIRKIELFRREYSASKAILWYTYDSFVFKLVNQAFRTEDTSLWYLFRFYIADLRKQLEIVHREQNLNDIYTLYRGQSMIPAKEFENIRTNIGGLISTNGFFSTSRSYEQALQFLNEAIDSDDFKVVVFQVKLPANQLKNTIFVDVDLYLQQSGEQEILFDIGTIFRIGNIQRDDNNKFWLIEIIATDERTDEIRNHIDSIKQTFQKGNFNLLFGRLLLDMHQYLKADAYFQMMLQVLPSNHRDLASIHDYIGDLKMRTTNYYNAFKHFQIAYKLKSKNELGITYNNFGNYYKAIGDTDQALIYYKKVLTCKNNLINTAITQLNIGTVCLIKKSTDEARNWVDQAYKILEQIQPLPHTEMIMYRAIMGDIYFQENDLIQSELEYLLAWNLCKKYLSIGDYYRTRCLNTLADLYAKQDGNSQRALDFCFEQLSVHEKYLFDSHHSSIGHIQMKIAELSKNKQRFEIALEIFEQNLHEEYAMVSYCQIMLAKYCEYNQAIKYYSIANEIRKRIYPPNHSILLECEEEIKKLKHNFDNDLIQL